MLLPINTIRLTLSGILYAYRAYPLDLYTNRTIEINKKHLIIDFHLSFTLEINTKTLSAKHQRIRAHFARQKLIIISIALLWQNTI